VPPGFANFGIGTLAPVAANMPLLAANAKA
jgi:hypothetical protein